jgi:Tol biopolymer transport system component
MRFFSLFIFAVVVLFLTSCAAPPVTLTATATIAPTPTLGVDPCLTTAKTYKPGSLPPGRIAFECYRDANKVINIYLFDTTTGGIVKLTDDTSLNYGVRWSPDGRQIAFHSTRDARPGTYLMKADSTQLKWLVDGGCPRWSPSGKQVAFWRGDGLYVMSANGEQPIQLTDRLASSCSMIWSPDARRLAFAAKPNGIHMINADGTHDIVLTDYSADFGDLAWSPDESQLYFLSAHGGPLELYRVDANGDQPTRLASASTYIDFFALSPDGTKIVFRDDSKKAYVMNSDGTQIRQLLDTNPSHLSWSPDGQYLAFAFDQLTVVKVDTGQIITLTDTSAFVDYPQWSPK